MNFRNIIYCIYDGAYNLKKIENFDDYYGIFCY
jgi:hypothetical protein